MSPATAKNEIINYINTRIENLRPKLLDLGRRNPLLAIKFSERSNSHIRIVDELPEVILNFISENELRLISLPPLEDDPTDEKNKAFLNALANARLTDGEYKKKAHGNNEEEDDGVDEKLAKAERELKDRIRSLLRMAPRQTRSSLSIAQHAKNNNISSSYDLPLPNTRHHDGRHDDKNIQTLLLPDMLERKLNALMTKCRTWIEETGIDVLRAGFGLLEWTDTETSEPSLAPLLLLPIQIEKKRTRNGYEFFVQGLGDLPEVNTVLIEKLKIDFGITLPEFTKETKLEDYFLMVNKLTPRGLKWKVRRQVAMGVFPSARMAMYHDLNTQAWDFSQHDVIQNLLGSSLQVNTGSMFGDEYHIDDPKVESKVPILVTDADSSQFSAIVDVSDGKNIAVEGPPGTGKSQTIVNTIAAFLAKGKKVLFVAEKTAALDVVKSRLEACNLGPFLLTLQPTRSSKEQIMESIRERLLLRSDGDAAGLDESITQFRSTRSKLQSYITAMSSIHENTCLPVHEILGWSISTRKIISKMHDSVLRINIPDINNMRMQALNEIFALCNQLESCWKKSADGKKYWSGIGLGAVDPFTADEILKKTKICAQHFKNLSAERVALTPYGIDKDATLPTLVKLRQVLEKICQNSDIDVALIDRLASANALTESRKFLNDINETIAKKDILSKILVDPMNPGTVKALKKTALALETLNISKLSNTEAAEVVRKNQFEIDTLTLAIHAMEDIIQIVPDAKYVSADQLVAMCDIASTVSRSVLALRIKELESPDIREFITKGKNKAATLGTTSSRLSKYFHIDSLPETIDIFRSANVLGIIGIFDYFKPTYRNAKKLYQSISKSSFSRHEAVDRLRELYSFIIEREQFLSDVKLKHILSQHFDGLDTNFIPFEELINYYDKIGDKLVGISNTGLREHLRNADIESITSLLSYEASHPIRMFSQPIGELLSMRAVLLNCSERLRDAQRVVINESIKFINPESVNSNQFRELTYECSKLNEACGNISKNLIAQAAIGNHFNFLDTKMSDIEPSYLVAEEVVRLGEALAEVVVKSLRLRNDRRLLKTIKVVIELDQDSEKMLTELTNLVQIDASLFTKDMNRRKLSDFLDEASMDKDGLMQNSAVALAKNEFIAIGYGPFIDAMLDTGSLDNLANILNAVCAQAMAKEVYKQHGRILAQFTGNKLDNLRARLAELDSTIIKLSRKRLKYFVKNEADPPRGRKEGRRSEWTEMFLLENEISKKKRYISARDLTKRAGRALLELKPCWMMSPLAVAQYIQKGQIQFDLVIIDEASQMTPEDAIGAIARSKQSMIVGDTNQLPPSTFFQKFIDIDEDENDDAVTQESILEIANSVFRPARRLKWHYRSKHPALIAFSNKYIYDSNLVVFPPPFDDHENMGVSYRKINGFYSSGTNPIEAKEIVDAMIKFTHTNKGQSLGVAVMNQKQRDLIEEEWEYALANDHDAQSYVEFWEKKNDGLEKLFIKNLENVQGDERDTIIIGTVYGPEKEGAPVMQRFGPINGVTGRRRLNVLFTRAKQKIITYSSMTGADIRADQGANEGAFLLKKWLEYSATGKILLDKAEVKERETESLFEDHVIQQLQSIGCQTIPQVGVSGYFIDIGVRHAQWPHGFIMGIECDGAAYHSSKSARDRDRLRQQVLEGFGWRLHRVWSTDWFDNPIRETEKLRNIIKDRLRELQQK